MSIFFFKARQKVLLCLSSDDPLEPVLRMAVKNSMKPKKELKSNHLSS